jgi:hypothetical protein
MCSEKGWTPYFMLRCVLSAWALWRRYRALPVMQLLQPEGAFPLPMSRYGEIVLRRWRARLARRDASTR